jgi:hypothetical protein
MRQSASRIRSLANRYALAEAAAFPGIGTERVRFPTTGGPLPNSGTAFRASPIKCDQHCARARQHNPGPRLLSSFQPAICQPRGSLCNLTEF